MFTVGKGPDDLAGTEDDKKVRFTKGNLYWNGSAWHLESKQYEYPSERNEYHVGHFYWSKTASVAYASSYYDDSTASNDHFFCDGSDADHTLTVDGQSGLYALSSSEWKYLLSSTGDGGRGDGDRKFKYGVTVAGKLNCLIIAPDDYSGSIESSYDATAWSAAESQGLVCLPAAEYWNGSEFISVENQSHYWSSTPVNDKSAQKLFFTNDEVSLNEFSREYGCSVRLVCSAQ